MSGIDRRTFLKGVGAAALTAWAGPPLLSRVASASQGWGPDSGLFAYGVASGDPLPSGITLWTRAKGPSGIPDVTSVDWKLALDPEFSTIVVSGSSGVSVENDYCAVVAVDGLDPGMNYYYKFEAGTDTSPIGRTRTAPDPASSVNGLRFAIASCQDFQAGYYHAWKHMAQQDLDFVMFLGDYIYEYGTEEHRLRPHDPSGEIFTLDDYRRRYRHYRGDPWLREAHRLHPFIVVWDDHEVANDRCGATPRPEVRRTTTLTKAPIKSGWLPRCRLTSNTCRSAGPTRMIQPAFTEVSPMGASRTSSCWTPGVTETSPRGRS